MANRQESSVVELWRRRSILGDMMAAPPPVDVEVVEKQAMEVDSEEMGKHVD